MVRQPSGESREWSLYWTARGRPVPCQLWAQDWRTHFLRLTALLGDNTTTAERDAAARSVSDADRELIGQLLTGRYTA